MIVIFDLKGEKLKSIPHEDEFFNHISAGELLEDHPEYEQSQWKFTIFPWKRVAQLSDCLKKEFLTPTSEQAYAQQLGLIEVCRGDFGNPTWVLITPNLNVGALKKEWYFEYCKKHGYFFVEDDVRSESFATPKEGEKL